MFLPDLGPDCYFASGEDLRAVGWLGRGNWFQRGVVTEEFLAVLKAHVEKAYQPVYFMGFHLCDLCERRPGPHPAGLRNLLIPGKGCLYVAPEMIVHYIERHDYRPPDEFIEAVLSCPDQESAEYMARVRPFERHWTDRA